MISAATSPSSPIKPKWPQRLGLAALAFFLIKGLIWLALFALALHEVATRR